MLLLLTDRAVFVILIQELVERSEARRDLDFLREWKLKFSKGKDPACRSLMKLKAVLAAVQVTFTELKPRVSKIVFEGKATCLCRKSPSEDNKT
jgi:hypothetical protein